MTISQPIAPRWWETASAITRVSLKAHGQTLGDLIGRLDRLKSQGFDAIELFAPCAGGTCYNGLDTIDFYCIDPAIGTLEDFYALIQAAHARGMAIVIFINLGYSHEQFPAFLKACDDVRNGIDSAEARWFVWSETGDDVMAKPLAPFFLQDSHGNWRWSERAGKYLWVKWEGERGGYHLPQFNFGDPGWQAEVRHILRFWHATGIDGVVIDAVNWYIDCDWEITRASMTDVIDAYPNQFSHPEGAGGFRDDPVLWVSRGGFNCIMDYSLNLWWENIDIIRDAVLSGDPRPIEEALRGYRDRVAAASGICYVAPPRMRDAPPAAQLLGAATTATVGELLLDLDAKLTSMPDEQQHQLVAILTARRRYPALCAAGARIQLPTSDDSRFYAFIRRPQAEGTSMLVVLNFQPEPQKIEVDLRGQDAAALVDIVTEQQQPGGDTLSVQLPAYGYKIYALR